MTRKNLPPLEVGTAYRAADFDHLEFATAKLTGSEAILRLHLKNGTTVDLPTTDAELKRLAILLSDVFPSDVIAHLKSRNWI